MPRIGKPKPPAPKQMTTRQLYEELEELRRELIRLTNRLDSLTTRLGSEGLRVAEPINEFKDIPF